MTSAPSRLLQLSGNSRNIIFSSLLMISLSSCSLFSHTNKTPVKKEPEKQTTDTKTETQKEEEKKNDTTSQSAEEKKKAKKDKYNITYLLPFSIDEAELSQMMGEEKITGYQPLAAIEFYEGALMALDTLKKYGVTLDITVLDNKKDSLLTSILLNTGELKTADLIIGPVFNESLKAGALFAKQNEIYMLSPLSPSANLTNENQYFLMANSTLHTQLLKTIEYISTGHPKANFILAYRTDKENEMKIATEFKSAFEEVKKNNPFITLREAYTFSGISSNMNAIENFVFISSNEELFVNSLLRDLSKSARDKDITLIGLQSILSFESVSLDYFENLHLHYPTAYWVDQNKSVVQNFNTAFTAKYDIKPSEYAYRGYDLTLYFGSMLKNYGPDLVSAFDKYNLMSLQMLGKFDFRACKNGDKVKFYENENITILKYENYTFRKVN